MALDHTNYLSLRELLSEVVGSPILIILLSLVLTTYLCVKLNVDSKTTIILNVLVAVMMLGFVYEMGVLIIVGVVLAFIIYGAYAAFWK